jgi:rubrerythrin
MKLFNMLNEDFVCENCGEFVKKSDYTARDHCPICLYSKHLDINPGDRAEDCHGILEPIGLETNPKKGYVIIFKCKKCGEIRRNKVAEDDDMNKIIELSAKHN